LQAQGQSIPFWTPGGDVGEHWDIEFTPRIPLEMEVSSAVGDVDLDLSGLMVTELDVSSGVGETTVAFPAAAGSTRASVKAAIGDITVQIPDGVGARIRVSKLLASVDVKGKRFTRSGDEYVSTDYDTAENKLDLEINSVIGDITIQ
jgi:predicted membrane protein